VGISHQLEASTCHDDAATCGCSVGSNEFQSKVYILFGETMHYMFAGLTNACVNSSDTNASKT